MVCALRLEHPLTQSLVALFSSERSHADAVLDAIRRAAAALNPAPRAVWLYGSVARAEDAPASDIDIAVVTTAEDPGPQAAALRDAIAGATPWHEHRISVVGLGLRDVRRLAKEGAPFWRNLERDAVVLAGDAPAGLLGRKARRGRTA